MRHYAFAPDPGSGLSNVVQVFMGNVSDTDAGGAHIRPGLMGLFRSRKGGQRQAGNVSSFKEISPSLIQGQNPVVPATGPTVRPPRPRGPAW